MEHSAAAYVIAAREALATAETEVEHLAANEAAPVNAAIGQGWALLAVVTAVQETGSDLGDILTATP